MLSRNVSRFLQIIGKICTFGRSDDVTMRWRHNRRDRVHYVILTVL